MNDPIRQDHQKTKKVTRKKKKRPQNRKLDICLLLIYFHILVNIFDAADILFKVED